MKLSDFIAKKILVVIVVAISLILISVSVYFYLSNKQKSTQQNQLETKITHSECLSDNEEVISDSNRQSSVGPMDIIIKDKKNGEDVFKFTIDSVLFAGFWAQPRKCGVYVLRIFNYNPTDIIKSASENKYEIWYYSYNGEGKPLLLLSKDFNLEFSVDFLEVYIALTKGYLGKMNFATVIKETKTKEDVFLLKHEDIINKYPDLEGVFGLKGWTKDSRYFWGDLFYGAPVFGFFRIERDTWKVDILPAPQDVLGGDALNLEKGLITVHPGNVWYGIDVITEQEVARRRAQGIGTELYIYNLFTKKQSLVATTTEPLWYFKPKWFSDTELEYYLPNGEKKVYEIIEK